MAKNKVGIAGAVNMGLAIAWAMEKLGYDLVVLDQNEYSLYKCQKALSSSHNYVRSTSFATIAECKLVISSKLLFLTCFDSLPFSTWFDLLGRLPSK